MLDNTHSDKRIDNYVFNTRNKLGQGSYGIVYAGFNAITKQKVAIKMLNKSQIDSDDYNRQAFVTEIKIMKQLSCPHIVKLIEVCESPLHYYVIQEYCDGGDLQKFLQKNKQVQADIAKDILIQILMGFQELIRFGVIHRDLKPANILISDGKYKLTDFGLSKNVTDLRLMMSSCVGTPLYMSPQILSEENYSSKCDIWSLGLIFYECIYGKCPWYGKSQQDLLSNILLNDIRFPLFPKISNLAKAFIIDCLKVTEEQRMSWDQVYRHPFVKDSFKNLITIQDNAQFIISKLRQLIIKQRLTPITLFQRVSKNRKIILKNFHEFVLTINPKIQLEESKFIFQLIDANKNEFIEMEELKAWFLKNDIVNSNFMHVDKDPPLRQSISQLQKSEDILKKIVNIVEQYKIDVDLIFNRFDLSGDGVLDQEEIFKMALLIDPTLTESELLTIFLYFDINKTGNIRCHDFKQVFTSETDLVETKMVNVNKIQASLLGPGAKLTQMQQLKY